MSPASTECPKCGVPVKPGASEGLCPRCLVAGVLSRSALPPETREIDTTHIRAEFPRPFGEYELLGPIARGMRSAIASSPSRCCARGDWRARMRCGDFSLKPKQQDALTTRTSFPSTKSARSTAATSSPCAWSRAEAWPTGRWTRRPRPSASGSETVAGVTLRSRSTTLGELLRVALSPDGRWLASGSAGSFVRVWSLTNQQVQFVIATGSPRGLAFTADSRRLVVSEGGGTKNDLQGRVKVYDLATHQRLRVFENVTGHFACSPDGRSLVVALPERWIELRHLESGAMRRRWLTDDALVELAWSPDGRFIAGIGADHTVRLWDVPQMVERRVLRGHGDELLAVAFSPSGDLIASCGKDATARLWPVNAPASERGWRQGRDPVAISSDGRFVATRSTEGLVQLGDVHERRLHVLPPGPARHVLGFIGKAGVVATVERSDSEAPPLLRHWNPSGEAGGEAIAIPDVAPGRVSATGGAPAARLAAMAVGKAGLVVFDLVTGAIQQRLTWQRREVTWLQFSPNGLHLAAVSWPNRARLWHLGTNQPVADWAASEGVVQRLAFSADGGLLATAGDDNLISIWETAAGGWRNCAGTRPRSRRSPSIRTGALSRRPASITP